MPDKPNQVNDDTPTTPARARACAAKLGISSAEAARQLGVSKQALSQWEQKGWVVRWPDRSVDLEATKIRVDSLRDPTRGGKPSRGVGAVVTYSQEESDRVAIGGDPLCAGNRICSNAGVDPEKPGSDESPPENMTLPAGMDLQTARTIKEYWQGLRAEAEYRKSIGELVPVVDAERVYLDILVNVRAAVEALPTRMANRLVGLDAQAIRKVMTDEISIVLRGLNAKPVITPTDNDPEGDDVPPIPGKTAKKPR